MLEFSRLKFISFDCYGTLIDWESGILSVLRALLQEHTVALSDSDVLKLYGELEAEAEAGEYKAYRDVLREVVCGFGNRFGFAASPSEQNSLPESLASWQP